MDYRDDRDALRDKVEGLEHELIAARQKLAEQTQRDGFTQRAEALTAELRAMRGRIVEIEEEIRTLHGGEPRPAPRPKGTRIPRWLTGGVTLLVVGLAVTGGYLRNRTTTPEVLAPTAPSIEERAPEAPPKPPELRAPEGPQHRVYVAQSCFLEAGSGEPDIAMLARSPGDLHNYRLTVHDGATGKQRWASEWTIQLLGFDGVGIHCSGADTVLVSDRDSTVRAIEAATGAERWKVHTADAPRAAAFGAGCAAVELVDHTTATLDLATGKNLPCTPTQKPWEGRLEDGDRNGAARLDVGGVTVTLRAKPQGTPVLTVSATGAARWETKLAQKLIGGAYPQYEMVAAKDTIVVVGEDASVEGKAYLVGLARDDGAVRYTKELGTFIGLSIRTFRLRGRYLYVYTGGSMHAFEPSTGVEVWRVGR